MPKKKSFWLLLFFLVFAAAGYWREYFFVHMNNIMYMKYYNISSPLAVPRVMQMFQDFSYDTLYYQKYLYTVLWSTIFYFLNYFALRKLTANRVFTMILLYAYLVMFFLAGVSMLYGYFVSHHWNQEEYTLSRWLMGIAQSPLICLILLAAQKLYAGAESRNF